MQTLEIFPFFTKLHEQEKEELKGLLRPMNVTKGTIVHYQGDICENTLLLVKGKIRLYSQADDFSEEVTLYTLNEGEQCLSNIISVLESTSVIPTAVAETDVEAYLVNIEEMEKFILRIPIYQEFILSLYAKKVVELTIAIQSVKFKNLDERIMDYLKDSKKKYY
jgi:CRP/FNR family transcriptional regulator